MSKTTKEYDLSKTCSGLPAPTGWHVVMPWGETGLAWERLLGSPLRVIEDIATRSDGRKWLHVSISRPNNKMPSWEDVQVARKLFVSEDRECYMTFPTKDRYVNLGNVLHLWCCLDAPEGVLPRFEEETLVFGKKQLSI